MKWTIDPGLDGDVDCDRPYLYGNALSSLNILRVFGKGELKGEENGEGEEKVKVLEEGGEGGGEEVRRQLGVPEGGAQARKSYFLGKEKVDEWVWEEGRVYGADFFNPYLDFNGSFFPFFSSSSLLPPSTSPFSPISTPLKN